MGLSAFVGRVFLAFIFIAAGVVKIQAPKDHSAIFVARYPVFHKWVETQTKQYFPLPEQLSPKLITAHANELILGVGAAEAGLGLLVIFGFGFAGKLLALLTLSFIAVIHNPLIHGKDHGEKLGEYQQLLLNLGIVGGLLLVGARRQHAPEAPKKVAQQQQPKKSEKAGKKRD